MGARLKEHRAKQKQMIAGIKDKAILANFRKYNLVFPSTIGLPSARHNLTRRHLKPALTLAGLDAAKYSFKSLRHTNASIMAEKVGPKRLQKHLGHERIETTLNYYVHVEDDSEGDFSDKFVETLY